MTTHQGRDGAETPAPGGPGAGRSLVGIEEFRRIDLRAAKVLEASVHPSADRLLVLRVDAGDPEPRTIVAGIRSDWPPEALVGRTVVIVHNLEPAMLRGVESQGMLLAVRGEERVILLGVDGAVRPGTRVT
jgi:methionine--tRNA ligase beta chain